MAFVPEVYFNYADGAHATSSGVQNRLLAGNYHDVAGTPGGSLAWESTGGGRYRGVGWAQTVGNTRRLIADSQWNPNTEFDVNNVGTVWSGGVIELIALPTSAATILSIDVRTATDGVIADTIDKAAMALGKTGADWRFAVMQNDSNAFTVALFNPVLTTKYIYKLRYVNGTVAQGGGGHLWVWNMNGSLIEEVDRAWNTTGPEAQRQRKLFFFQGLDATGLEYALYESWSGYHSGGGAGGDPAVGKAVRVSTLTPVSVDTAGNWTVVGDTNLATATDDPGGDPGDDGATTYAQSASATNPDIAKINLSTFDTANVDSVLSVMSRVHHLTQNTNVVFKYGIDLSGVKDVVAGHVLGTFNARFKVHNSKPGGGAWAVGDVANVKLVYEKADGNTSFARVTQGRVNVLWVQNPPVVSTGGTRRHTHMEFRR